MNSFPECEQFKDHRRAICRGERPDLSRDVVDRYRALWGLGPLVGNAAPPSPPDLPSLVKRVTTFAIALTEHLRDGLAKCDATEIDSRLQICQGCPLFTGTHCRECGCACSDDTTFFNKLAWRSEKCPAGRW